MRAKQQPTLRDRSTLLMARLLKRVRSSSVKRVAVCAVLLVLAGVATATLEGSRRRAFANWGLWKQSPDARPLDEVVKPMEDGSYHIAEDITASEAEALRQSIVKLLTASYKRGLMPFSSPHYPQERGVLDRVPLEKFLDVVEPHLSQKALHRCLEWGPFFKRWLGVTQPYMSRFKCEETWEFKHRQSGSAGVFRRPWGLSVVGELDVGLAEQGLLDAAGMFDLLIVPQTFQYVSDPLLSARVLYDLLAPGGYVMFATPFTQIVLTMPVDYYRFTAEGNEHLLKSAGFDIVESHVGGNDLFAICWLMRCGTLDMDPEVIKQFGLRPRGEEYSATSYMMSAQLARKPHNAPLNALASTIEARCGAMKPKLQRMQ